MTKGGHPEIVQDMPNFGKTRLSYNDMLSDLEHSLQKLKTDYIDIYFYHRDDLNQSVEEEPVFHCMEPLHRNTCWTHVKLGKFHLPAKIISKF